MADRFDRANVTSLRVTSEAAFPSAVVYLGEKSVDTAIIHSVLIIPDASATTDGMDILITCRDAAGNRIPGVFALEVWISEAADGAGLTADSYSGDVTASVGAILTAFTEKKHFSVVTSANGTAVLTAVDSANPTDQYVAVKNPVTGRVHVSNASGENWEGA